MSTTHLIRPARPNETNRLLTVAFSTGLFTLDEATALLGDTLRKIHEGVLGPQHQAIVFEDARNIVQGWVYVAPNDHADRIWDLWWIGVDPACQNIGIGKQLLDHVEATVVQNHGRMLIIETSANLERTMRFYKNQGYSACGRIPNYYGAGEDKVTFAKELSGE
ncbi:acyl-CoA N-acyltransferase [Chytriomyces sp. MP71]|nr:acyl-CoA N-acyltransferase [Chytriomyces sp. MP71]